jgi:transposase
VVQEPVGEHVRTSSGATGIEKLAVVADRGYFSGEEVLACEQGGITAYVPKLLTSGTKADGRFGKQDFVHMPDQDEYRRPARHAMTRRFATVDKGLFMNGRTFLKCCLHPGCEAVKASRHVSYFSGNPNALTRR